MTKVFNGHDHLVSLAITLADGTTDGIHLQPYARVRLQDGTNVTPNSLALNPKVRLEDVLTVQPVAAPVVEVAEVAAVEEVTTTKKK